MTAENETAAAEQRIAEIVRELKLEKHPEGGWFAEVYTALVSFAEGSGQRALAGSIYYLLGGADISAFHEIDCDELWYYHEGSGLRVYILKMDGQVEERLLGRDFSRHESPMIVIPAGAFFAAENIDPDGYTLVSCMTTPKFRYAGWRLVPKEELLLKYPGSWGLIQRFAD